MFGAEEMHIQILSNELSSETGFLRFNSLKTTRKENIHRNVFKHYTNLYFKDVLMQILFYGSSFFKFDKTLHSMFDQMEFNNNKIVYDNNRNNHYELFYLHISISKVNTCCCIVFSMKESFSEIWNFSSSNVHYISEQTTSSAAATVVIDLLFCAQRMFLNS